MTAEGPRKRGPFFSALCGQCLTYSLADLIEDTIREKVQFLGMALSLSLLIRFDTSTWTYEGWPLLIREVVSRGRRHNNRAACRDVEGLER
jgi:hypothetical protein